ncbi:cytoplasmic protein [Nitrospira sp. Ecomares 2.1]
MSRPPFPTGPRPTPRMGGARPPAPPGQAKQFESLRASLLFCPKCQTATPARERLLLVLPTGSLYEYLCAHCGTSTGSKTDQAQSEVRLITP